jgi:hypothetical protein
MKKEENGANLKKDNGKAFPLHRGDQQTLL